MLQQPSMNKKQITAVDWGSTLELVSHGTQTNTLLNWKFNTTFFGNDTIRSLISESCSVFESVQRLTRSEDNTPLTRPELIKASRKYRSIIHASRTSLRNDEQNEAFKTMLSQIEAIWSLCEILYIDIQSLGSFLNQLLTWIRWHFTAVVTKAEQVIGAENPCKHACYWEVITRYVLQGEIENAIQLIEFHPWANVKDEFLILKDMMKKMPINSQNQLLHEFYLRWKAWSEECRKKVEEGTFAINKNIENIMRVLSGDVLVFKELSHFFESWYQLMVSFLLYTDPCIKENPLEDLCHVCIDIYFGNNRNLSLFDEVIISAFSYDLIQVIRRSCQCFVDNWLFVAHFIDLLYNANQLEQHNLKDEDKLREFFVVSYATTLLSHHSLWFFGVNYLDYCPTNGQKYLELYLQRVAPIDETTARKIIFMAESRNLSHISKSVYKVLARRRLAEKRYGAALSFALRSLDAPLTTYLANIFLVEYHKNGVFPDEDVLNNLSPNMLFFCDRLTFVAKYFEFKLLMKECQLAAAGELLVSLLSSSIAPKFFIETLLMESLSLLESKQVVLNVKQTCQILESLEDFIDNEVKQNTNQDALSTLKEKEEFLRLALSRNLARSFVRC